MRVVVHKQPEFYTESAVGKFNKRWDFGTYKFHPLWDEEPSPTDVQAITVGGEPLFRGTTSDFLDAEGLHTHPPGGHGAHIENRIYVSEGAEDASGYGCIEAENMGGTPLLCTIQVDQDLFKALKPGYEGLGEWYVDREFIPRRLVKCRRIPLGECEERGFAPVAKHLPRRRAHEHAIILWVGTDSKGKDSKPPVKHS